MPKKLLQTGQITATQDGNREFITLIASICADGTSIPPALIYQGTGNALQNTWIEEVNSTAQVYFASSENGWSSDQMGLHWLKEVFNRHTKDRDTRIRARRMLIVDGHSSHVNLKFIEYADQNRILIAVLPPHSTHRLQPLDVGLFSPLATYYSQQIELFLAQSQGISHITKRDFWPCFREAYVRAFTPKNILSAWERVGIHPFNPQKVIPAPVTPPILSPRAKSTPATLRSMRRTYSHLKQQGHVNREAHILLRAAEKLAAQNAALRYEVEGLRKAMIQEKKKRKRGKSLLLHEEGERESHAIFFSPTKVVQVLQRQADLEHAQLQRRQDIDERRLQSTRAREEKAREAQERREERERMRLAAREQNELKKAEKQAQIAARKAERLAKKLQDEAQKQARRRQAEEAKKQAAKIKKRTLDTQEELEPRKRGRKSPPQGSKAHGTHKPGVKQKKRAIELQGKQIAAESSVIGALDKRNAQWRPNPHQSRSGRSTRLPVRFS